MREISSKRKTLVQILKTSLPAAVDLSSQTVTWLIEAIFIGHLSTAALAGVGIAQQIILLTFSTILTFVMGSSIIVARYLGSWLLAIPLGFGLSGLWFAQGLDEATRFLLNLWRFNRGRWKEISL